MLRKFQNRSNIKISWALVAVAAFVLPACTVGPNYHRPVVQTPTVFHGAGESQPTATQTESFADLPWWEVFHDPQLQALIRTARKQNYDLQLQITKETVQTQENSVKLTELRLSHGLGTRLDVLQSRQVLDTANAQIPDLERQIGQTEDAINILLGNYPQGVPRGTTLGVETQNGWQWRETLPPQLPPRVPSALLERRPDIRAVEQNLVAANANIGVAKAMFFPRISLLGSGGAAFGHSALLASPLGIGSYAASAAQPLFTGGALRNNLRYAKSQERQAPISYQQTIQRALVDVSDALSGYEKYHGVRERQEQTVKDLQESVDVSLMRY